jgi:hypothetical protein
VSEQPAKHRTRPCDSKHVTTCVRSGIFDKKKIGIKSSTKALVAILREKTEKMMSAQEMQQMLELLLARLDEQAKTQRDNMLAMQEKMLEKKWTKVQGP